MWSKQGDFSRVANSGRTLRHYCSYANDAPGAIKKLILCQYSSRQYKIMIHASNDASYRALIHQITQAGFPAPSGLDRLTNELSLLTPDRSIIANFLNAIKPATPELSEIELEVCETLGVNLGEAIALPTWLKENDFTLQLEPSYRPMTNSTHYKTTSPLSLIKAFDLYGYTDNEFMFNVTLSEDAAPLRTALIASGLPLQFSDDGVIARLRFNTRTRENFNRLLATLSEHSTHFSEIADTFTQNVTPVIAASALASPGVTLFRAVPDVTNNEKKLEDVGFSEEALTAEEKIKYGEYCCSISTRIMTEPVFDPRFPQYQFEKSEILRWLAIKQEHPFTKAKLTPADLEPNFKLTIEINRFIDDTVLAYQQKAASSIPK